MTVHDHSTRPSDIEVNAGPASANAGWAPPVGQVPGASGMPPTWSPPTAAGSGDTRPGSRRTKLAVAGAIVAAAVASAGVTAGIMAGNGGTSAAASGGPGGGGQGFGGQQGGLGGAAGGAAGGTMAALHGTYVVSDGNGGYLTELTQTGTVSAVSSSSITVKSTDGFTKTYVVSGSTSVDNGSDAIGDVATGHTVRVVATSANDQATATQIQDTNIASTTQQGGPGGQGGPAGGTGTGTQQGGTGTGTGT
jgi:hypothetical protein